MKGQMKHFTLIELGSDAESPMIGSFDNVINSKLGLLSFKERIITALCEHFDTNDVSFDELPDMFTGSPYEDFKVKIKDYDDTEVEYDVRLMETWLY